MFGAVIERTCRRRRRRPQRASGSRGQRIGGPYIVQMECRTHNSHSSGNDRHAAQHKHTHTHKRCTTTTTTTKCACKLRALYKVLCERNYTRVRTRTHTKKNHEQFQFSYPDHIDNFSKTCLIYKMCVCVFVRPQIDTERKRCHHSLCAPRRRQREELFIFGTFTLQYVYVYAVCDSVCMWFGALAFTNIKLK